MVIVPLKSLYIEHEAEGEFTGRTRRVVCKKFDFFSGSDAVPIPQSCQIRGARRYLCDGGTAGANTLNDLPPKFISIPRPAELEQEVGLPGC